MEAAQNKYIDSQQTMYIYYIHPYYPQSRHITQAWYRYIFAGYSALCRMWEYRWYMNIGNKLHAIHSMRLWYWMVYSLEVLIKLVSGFCSYLGVNVGSEFFKQRKNSHTFHIHLELGFFTASFFNITERRASYEAYSIHWQCYSVVKIAVALLISCLWNCDGTKHGVEHIHCRSGTPN